jgi:hypothetical protein
MLWSVKAFRIAERIVVADQNSCIISTFPPVNTHLIALALKRRYPSVQWVADFRDPLANSPSRLASPQDRQFPRLCSFAEQKLQARIFAAADKVVANSDRVADIWRSQVPQYAHKIEHIWNGFDSEEDLGPKPIPPRPFQVIAHVGGIFGYRSPGMLLESLERLIDAGRVDPATVRVRQVGSVSGPELLGRFSRLREIGCLEELGRVPKPQAEAELQTADKLLLLDVDHPDAGQQVPSKVFEYLRIGRPVLAFTPKQSPTERIVLGSGIPSFAISSDMPAAEVDWRVVEFLSWPADPVAPSGWFLQEFDASARVRKLISLLES